MLTYISTCLVVMVITKLKLSFPENRISSRLQWKCRNMISANHPVARPNENGEKAEIISKHKIMIIIAVFPP